MSEPQAAPDTSVRERMDRALRKALATPPENPRSGKKKAAKKKPKPKK